MVVGGTLYGAYRFDWFSVSFTDSSLVSKKWRVSILGGHAADALISDSAMSWSSDRGLSIVAVDGGMNIFDCASAHSPVMTKDRSMRKWLRAKMPARGRCIAVPHPDAGGLNV